MVSKEKSTNHTEDTGGGGGGGIFGYNILKVNS